MCMRSRVISDRYFSVTETASCTARRSGVLRTKRRCSRHRRAIITGRGCPIHSRYRRMPERSQRHCASMRSGRGDCARTRYRAYAVWTCRRVRVKRALREWIPAQRTECAYRGEAGEGWKGLNLTWEVRDGILNHQSRLMPHTLEGKIVRFSDKIAYINHDIDDAIRALVLTEDVFRLNSERPLVFSTKQRLNTLIHNIIMNSRGEG